MGRLAGFAYRDVAKRLRSFGYEPSGRQDGSHEIWKRAVDHKTISVPRHTRDMREGTLRSILLQADIDVDAFLAD